MSRRVWVTRLSKPAGLAPSRKSSCAGRERERGRGEVKTGFFPRRARAPGSTPEESRRGRPFFFGFRRAPPPRALSPSLSLPPLPSLTMMCFLTACRVMMGLRAGCACVWEWESRERGSGRRGEGAPPEVVSARCVRGPPFFFRSAHSVAPTARALPAVPTPPPPPGWPQRGRGWATHAPGGGVGAGEGPGAGRGEKERASERAKKSKPCRSSALGSLRARARALPSPLLHIHVVLQDFRDHVVVRVLVRGGGHGCQFVGGGGGAGQRKAGGRKRVSETLHARSLSLARLSFFLSLMLFFTQTQRPPGEQGPATHTAHKQTHSRQTPRPAAPKREGRRGLARARPRPPHALPG